MAERNRRLSLIAAPFALGYYTLSNIAMYEAVVVGLLIAGTALWSALSMEAHAYLEYIDAGETPKVPGGVFLAGSCIASV
jgi:hypothetical protein